MIRTLAHIRALDYYYSGHIVWLIGLTRYLWGYRLYNKLMVSSMKLSDDYNLGLWTDITPDKDTLFNTEDNDVGC